MRNIADKTLLFAIASYLALAIFAFFFSDRIIFAPHPSSYKDGPNILKITTQTGRKISAIYLPNSAAALTLLVSHGNGEDLGDDRYWIEDLHRIGFSVLAYDYAGYGTSDGSPSEKAFYEDELAAYDYLVHELATPSEKIVIFGRSVGSGPAVYLAARRRVAGLILQSPFLSAFRVLTHIPILPFDKFPNYKDITRIQCPVFIIHGEADQLIPAWHGKRLFELAHDPKKYLPISRAGHNDLDMIAGPAYSAFLAEFAAMVNKKQATAASSDPKP